MAEQSITSYTIVPADGAVLADPMAAINPPPVTVVEAEWVHRYPARRRGQIWRWLGLVVKVGLALVFTYFFYIIPPSAFPDPFQNWKNPVVIFLLICFIGKTMLDTFFYDHYQP